MGTFSLLLVCHDILKYTQTQNQPNYILCIAPNRTYDWKTKVQCDDSFGQTALQIEVLKIVQNRIMNNPTFTKKSYLLLLVGKKQNTFSYEFKLELVTTYYLRFIVKVLWKCHGYNTLVYFFSSIKTKILSFPFLFLFLNFK